MTEVLITIIVTLSSDFRIHAHGGYFVDVRHGGRNGRQVTTRNPGTRPEVAKVIAEMRAAAERAPHLRTTTQPVSYRLDVIDEAAEWEARHGVAPERQG